MQMWKEHEIVCLCLCWSFCLTVDFSVLNVVLNKGFLFIEHVAVVQELQYASCLSFFSPSITMHWEMMCD